jgi:HEAT repeat protein
MSLKNANPSKPQEQYLDAILFETRSIKLVGIPLPLDRNGTPLPLELPLEKMYVHIKVIDRIVSLEKQEDENRDLERGGAHKSFRQSVDNLGQHIFTRETNSKDYLKNNLPIDPQKALERNKRMVILGAPGTGKSTLLRFIANKQAKQPASSIPILLSLKEYAIALSQDSTLSLMEFALRCAIKINPDFREVLESAIKAEKILWLLDGLDETYDWASSISRHVRFLPGQLVMTSRQYGYVGDGLEDFPHYEILPIIPEDSDDFLHHWFEVIAKSRNLDSNWVQEKINWINNELVGKIRIRSLTSNPLLLTFLAIISSNENNNEIPFRRSELYKRYTYELMTNWEINRIPNQDKLTKEIVLEGLFSIGWGLHFAFYGGKSQQLPTRESITKFLKQYKYSDWGEKTKEYTERTFDFWISTGLLETWFLNGIEYISFRHLTFQEYSAAIVLAFNWQKNRKPVWNFIRTRLHDPVWHEVIILMGSMIEPDQFEVFAKKLLKGYSRFENILKRDLLLLGEILIDRSHDESITNKYINLEIKKLNLLLWRNFIDPKQITEILEYFGSKASQVLINALNIKDRPTFEAVATSLGNTLKAKAIPYLVDCVEPWESENVIRTNQAIIQVLGDIGDPIAIPLLTSLPFPLPDFTTQIISSVSRIGGPAAIPFLVDCANGGRPPTITGGIIGLASLSEDCSPIIRQIAAEPENWQVREALKIREFKEKIKQLSANIDMKLGQFTVDDNNIIKDVFDSYTSINEELEIHYERDEFFSVIKKLPFTAIKPYLKKYLIDENAPGYPFVLSLLLQINSEESISMLVSTLTEALNNGKSLSDIGVAFNQLGDIPNPKLIPPLLESLDSNNSFLQYEAIIALGQIGDISIADKLFDVYKNTNNELDKLSAAISLTKIGDPRGRNLLLGYLLQKKPGYEVNQAIEALANTNDKSIVPHLLPLLRNDEMYIRTTAFDALVKLNGEELFPLLINAYKHEKDKNIREQYLLSLSKIISTIKNIKYLEILLHIMAHKAKLVSPRTCNSSELNDFSLFEQLLGQLSVRQNRARITVNPTLRKATIDSRLIIGFLLLIAAVLDRILDITVNLLSSYIQTTIPISTIIFWILICLGIFLIMLSSTIGFIFHNISNYTKPK